MVKQKLYNALTECGYNIPKAEFYFMSEAAQIQVADNILTEMFKFITDKYNSIDFSEIEKSYGDISKFKYSELIMENLETLSNIYSNSEDPGAKKYLEVLGANKIVYDSLLNHRDAYSTLYKRGNGIAQLTYTSLVAAMLYSISTMISNTIRFVTVEKDTDMEVIFDEIPGTIKHIHIKNIMSCANDIDTFNKMIETMYQDASKKPMTESALTGAVCTGFIIAGIILLIPKVLTLIREIIYSIYYQRVRISYVLKQQAELIRVNIESLETGRGNKKIIARQKKVARTLETMSAKIALKSDTAEVAVKTQIAKENKSMDIDRHSTFANSGSDGVLLL